MAKPVVSVTSCSAFISVLLRKNFLVKRKFWFRTRRLVSMVGPYLRRRSLMMKVSVALVYTSLTMMRSRSFQ